MPNESFKIKISGGSIFFVTVAEIQKISKEAAPVQNSNNPYFHDSEYSWGQGFHHYMRETSHLPAYMKKHRFYRTIEFRPGINNIGLRIVRGFKFNHFAQFGLGIGLDGVYFGKGISWGKGIYDNTNVNNGLYIPLYLQLTGDMRKVKITPYYYVEAGYAFHPANPFAAKNSVSKS